MTDDKILLLNLDLSFFVPIRYWAIRRRNRINRIRIC